MSSLNTKGLSESNRRVFRTVYQTLVALLFAVPFVLIALPAEVAAAPLVLGIGAWIAAVTKIINSLEDAGFIPAWLKTEPNEVEVTVVPSLSAEEIKAVAATVENNEAEAASEIDDKHVA